MNQLQADKAEAEKQLKKLIDRAGGPAHLARMIGVSPATVRNWKRRKAISKNGVRAVSSNARLRVDFPPEVIAPHIYHYQ